MGLAGGSLDWCIAAAKDPLATEEEKQAAQVFMQRYNAVTAADHPPCPIKRSPSMDSKRRSYHGRSRSRSTSVRRPRYSNISTGANPNPEMCLTDMPSAEHERALRIMVKMARDPDNPQYTSNGKNGWIDIGSALRSTPARKFMHTMLVKLEDDFLREVLKHQKGAVITALSDPRTKEMSHFRALHGWESCAPVESVGASPSGQCGKDADENEKLRLTKLTLQTIPISATTSFKKDR